MINIMIVFQQSNHLLTICLVALLTIGRVHSQLPSQLHVSFQQNHIFFVTGKNFGFISRSSGYLESVYSLQNGQEIMDIETSSQKVLLYSGKNEINLIKIDSMNVQTLDFYMSQKDNRIKYLLEFQSGIAVLTSNDLRFYLHQVAFKAEKSQHVVCKLKQGQKYLKLLVLCKNHKENKICQKEGFLLAYMVDNTTLCLRSFSLGSKIPVYDKCVVKNMKFRNIQRTGNYFLVQTEEKANIYLNKQLNIIKTFQGEVSFTNEQRVVLKNDHKTFMLRQEVFRDGMAVIQSIFHPDFNPSFFILKKKTNQICLLKNDQQVVLLEIEMLPEQAWIEYDKSISETLLALMFQQELLLFRLNEESAKATLVWKVRILDKAEQVVKEAEEDEFDQL